jgi:hypothetical protein
LWDLAARTELWTATTACPAAPASLAFRTGTDALVMVGCPAPATGGGTCKGISLQIWNAGPPGPAAPGLRCIADDRDLSQFALSADGDLVAAASCESAATSNATCEIRVWNTEGAGQVGAALVAPFPSSMVFSPDRRTLATRAAITSEETSRSVDEMKHAAAATEKAAEAAQINARVSERALTELERP